MEMSLTFMSLSVCDGSMWCASHLPATCAPVFHVESLAVRVCTGPIVVGVYCWPTRGALVVASSTVPTIDTGVYGGSMVHRITLAPVSSCSSRSTVRSPTPLLRLYSTISCLAICEDNLLDACRRPVQMNIMMMRSQAFVWCCDGMK